VTHTWNEIVVDTRSVEDMLPRVILAFFYIPGGDAGEMEGHRRRFSESYHLAIEEAPPVVELDLSKPSSPFTLKRTD